MERRLLLDVVVAERTAVLQLLTREDKTLLVRRNTLLVLDLGLHIVDRVRRLDLERDRLASQGLDEDLHGRQRQSFVRRKRKSGAPGGRPRSPAWVFAVLANVTCPQNRHVRGLHVAKKRVALLRRTEPLIATMSQSAADDVFTCITCSVAFLSAPEQRKHFQSDFHRYNMKRRVANLAPVNAQTFNDKIRERRAALESSEKASKEDHGRCDVCSKTFSSLNAYRDHMQSRKHREKALKYQPRSKAPLEHVREMKQALPEDDENVDDEERAIRQKLSKARRIDPANECMFCSAAQSSLEASMEHMRASHGFFVPERKYLVDLAGLLRYLADKVSVGNVCLWCNGRGRGFHDLGAVQKHMVDKSHCKVAYDTQEDQLELSDFYDFRSSYANAPTATDEWEDVEEEEQDDGDGEAVWEDDDDETIPDNGIRYGDSEYELVLPSGARLGHRSMQRYYRQSLWQTPAAHARETASTAHGRALAHRLADASSKELVVPSRGGQELVARNRGEAKEATRHVREFRDSRRRELFRTKVGFKHNHQKHYRDALLQ